MHIKLPAASVTVWKKWNLSWITTIQSYTELLTVQAEGLALCFCFGGIFCGGFFFLVILISIVLF